MKINTDEKTIDELLERGVSVILPTKEDLKKKLMSGEQLRIYLGMDATSPSLHLGHAKQMMFLEKFRSLGHKTFLLIGDFTARIGDPDKSSVRNQLSREEIIENIRNWIPQIKPILGIEDTENPTEVVYNHEWLSKLTFEDVITLASHMTVQQILERDMFEQRMKENKPIFLHEFMYPLMQGYDSVHLDVDIEICGNDQIFNALTGRTLQHQYKGKDKFIFAGSLIEDPNTGDKMSKSLGNGIMLDSSANDMYGSIMALPDGFIIPLFRDCTNISISDIKKIESELKSGTNPRDLKMKLAHMITKLFYNEDQANEAQKYFVNTIQKKEIPDDMPEYKMNISKISIVELLVHTQLVKSKTEARQQLQQHAIKIDGEIISEEKEIDIPRSGFVLQKGKRFFAKVMR